MTHEILLLTRIGSVLLAGCGIPQALKANRDPGSTKGLSWEFLAAWGVGELFMLGLAPVASWPVIANYAINALLVGFIAKVKWQNGA